LSSAARHRTDYSEPAVPVVGAQHLEDRRCRFQQFSRVGIVELRGELELLTHGAD
jgi:hypothetical protein